MKKNIDLDFQEDQQIWNRIDTNKFTRNIVIKLFIARDKKNILPWPGWLNWLPTVHKWKSHRFDSGQGTCPGCGFGPWSGRVQKATNQCISLTSTFLFLSFSLPSLLSGIHIKKKKNLENSKRIVTHYIQKEKQYDLQLTSHQKQLRSKNNGITFKCQKKKVNQKFYIQQNYILKMKVKMLI